jgi:hypothetical protein
MTVRQDGEQFEGDFERLEFLGADEHGGGTTIARSSRARTCWAQGHLLSSRPARRQREGELSDPSRGQVRVVMTCASCGFSNPSGHRFCGGCGSKLDEVSPSALAERRFVSVLFVDLVGFTPFSEGRDSEDVRAMLARYFELARAANMAASGALGAHL